MNIEIKNVVKNYGEKTVLDIENLRIKTGEITAVIGQNGSGKSTLLNIIAGLDEDHKGKVLYNGNPISKKIKKEITLVFQTAYLFRRSVYKNIEYPLQIRKIDEETRSAKVLELMKVLEIEDLKDKIGSKLSGGETQKVALARALVFEPELLLLDEPTSNIDPEYIKHMERAIKKYNEEGGTVIIVTHNIGQAYRISGNIVKLEKGKVVKDDLF